MTHSHNPTELPDGPPIPVDDGAAAHLPGRRVPSIALTDTAGNSRNLAELTRRPTVLFFYPRTGVPGQRPGLGFQGEEWDSIPGARGCTPQSCGFRDLYTRFKGLGVDVLGVSSSAHQREFRARNHVPFEFLSDSDLALTRSLRLPTFEFPVEPENPTTLIHRMAWFCDAGEISHVWYPVFPPNENAGRVLAWLEEQRGARGHDQAH